MPLSKHVLASIALSIAVASCGLAVTASAQVATFEDGSVNYGLGGDFSSLGLGTYGWFIPALESSLPSGTTVTASSNAVVHNAWSTWCRPDRWVVLPESNRRTQSLWYPRDMNSFTITVTTNAPCVDVSFYSVDGDSVARRHTTTPSSRPGNAAVTITDAYDGGVYVTLRQTRATETYTLTRVEGANPVVAAVLLDTCVDGRTAAPTTAPAPTTLPPPAAFADGSVNYVHGVGGDFTGLGLGSYGWFIPGLESSLPSGTTVTASGNTDLHNSWSPDCDPQRWVLVPGTTTRTPNLWYPRDMNSFTITVTTSAACVDVSFYSLDGDSIERRHTTTPSSRPDAAVTLTKAYDGGVYVTLRQTRGSETYTFTRIAGANPVVQAVLFNTCNATDSSLATPEATSRLPVGSLVYGASGDIAALDIGRLGYYLGGVGSDSSRASVPPSVTVGFLEAPGIAWTGSQASDASNWRLLAPPHGTRSRTGWFANVALRLFVAADECVVTRLYVLDYDSTARRVRVTATDASGNAVSLTTGESFHDGAWLTFEQRGTTEYRIEVVEGPNAALSGITFDTCDGSAPATNTPAPTCEAEYTWADAPTSCSARFDAEHPTLICQNLYDVLPTATDINTEFFAGGSWYHGEWAGLGTAPATLTYTYATPQLVNQMCYQQRFTNRGPDEYWSTVQLFFDGSATSAATINLNQDTLLRCYDLPSAQRVSTARLDFVRTNPSGMNPGGRTVTFVYRCPSAQPQAPGSDPRPPSAVAPAQRQSDDDGEEVSIEVIVIAALGCAVVVLLAIVLGCFCARRKSGDADAAPIAASVPAVLVMPADASAAGPAPMQEAHGQAVMGAVVCDSSPVAKPSAPLGYGVNAAHYNYPAQPSATSHVPSVVAAALPQTPGPDEDGVYHGVEPVNRST